MTRKFLDIRTSKIFLEIANSVSFLNLTVDCPSLHPSGFMPILDLQIKTENNQIIYKFYKKDVSNNRVILNKSAMPMKVKRITCIQEVIRRLRNTKRELSWSVKREILTEFSWSLYQSGYPERCGGVHPCHPRTGAGQDHPGDYL